MTQNAGDAAFPGITDRVGASGDPTPVIRGTGIRVQTMVFSVNVWGESAAEVAEDYGLRLPQVNERLAFYAAHRVEIDAAIQAEEQMAVRMEQASEQVQPRSVEYIPRLRSCRRSATHAGIGW